MGQRGGRASAKRARSLALPLSALALLALAGPQNLSGQLRSVAQTYYEKAGAVAAVTGRDTTMDYYQRLLDDADNFSVPPPSYYTAEQWQHSAQAIAQLDLSLAQQLLSGSYTPMASIRGLGETLVKSSKDGTMQPVAVYVPSTYAPGKPAPLVVFLHGRLQSETRLIAPQFITDIAEQNGTIIVAPYGRGVYDYKGVESDIYDALAAAQQAFTIDSNRRYLAGYSMGGFSVYFVAPLHPTEWSGVMSIAGALLFSRASAVTTQMSHTRFYVLTGANDDSIPTKYPTQTAVYLRNQGIPVTYYSQPNGTHVLYSLRPILAKAWSDMLRGVVGLPVTLSGDGELPEALP